MDEIDEFLIGKTLNGGWTITEPRHVQRDASSANRSYVARNANGDKAFVKVLDPRANNSLEEAQEQLSQFIYEKDVVGKCGLRNMKRVIRGLEYGDIRTPAPFSLSFHYLIFEWAESDLRSQINLDERAHLAVIYRWLHHVAGGLRTLHHNEIVHQDVKPANVLVMENRTAKVGDLGHAYQHGEPRSGILARDPAYLAPEMLYGRAADTLDSRRAVDMYAFGGMVCFLASGLSLNAALGTELAHMHHWSIWRGSFEDALIYVRRAHEVVIEKVIAELPALNKDRLSNAIRELCDPDPTVRGHPANLQGSGARFGFDRYESLFDLLARHEELERRRAN
jgi:serine/threonine protein kinase